MWFATELWWFLLGHLGFAATQTALPPIVINNVIIINKIPQCSDFRCHLTSCRAAGAFGRLGWDLEDSLPKTHQQGEHTSTRQHPALWSTGLKAQPLKHPFLCSRKCPRSITGRQQPTALVLGPSSTLPSPRDKE